MKSSNNEEFISYNNIKGDFTLNDNLVKSVLSNMPDSFNMFEKAYYIYRRLCDLLYYDEEYFCYSNGSSVFKKVEAPNIDHEDITRLSSITGNEGVICTEISMLYSKFLDMLNIPYQILDYNNNPASDYKKGHIKVRLKVDNYIIDADAAHGVFNSDMSAIKIFGEINCFNPIDPKYNKEVMKKKSKVDDYYESIYKQNEFNDALEIYENTYAKNKKIPFEDKVKVFKDIITKPNSPFIVMFSWVKELEDKIFGVNNEHCHAEFLINNRPTDSNKKYELALVIIYNEDFNLYDDVLANTYIVITEDRRVQELDILGFHNKIRNNILDYTSSKRKKLFTAWEEEYEGNRFSRL